MVGGAAAHKHDAAPAAAMGAGRQGPWLKGCGEAGLAGSDNPLPLRLYNGTLTAQLCAWPETAQSPHCTTRTQQEAARCTAAGCSLHINQCHLGLKPILLSLAPPADGLQVLRQPSQLDALLLVGVMNSFLHGIQNKNSERENEQLGTAAFQLGAPLLVGSCPLSCMEMQCIGNTLARQALSLLRCCL